MKPKMFEIAKKLSHRSPSKFKHGCVISDKRKIIGVGFNDMNKTYPKTLDPWKTLHAEVHALIGLDRSLTKGSTAYVYRETKDGKPANSKPCESCKLALQLAGIRKVYYTIPTSPYWEMMDLRYV